MKGPPGWLLSVALLTAGCSGWLRVPATATPKIDGADQVQVWIGGHATLLHAVRLTPDSIFGRKDHIECRVSSCEVALARAETDSIRRVAGTDPGTGSFAIGFAVGFGLVWFLLTGR
jgi:hypothetical protein